ncbi:MAG: hypothetical protein ACHP8A_19175, partial [Terriglobales bacterium]
YRIVDCQYISANLFTCFGSAIKPEAVCAPKGHESPGLNGASMKPPTLSRPAGKLFLLFLIHFGRHLTITHLFGFGA